ncbi:MAG: DEAD/DEAH box helicase [Proteobacteria bacterium]|nr:DEAD/DEAH box helicase [Pseudomonadota bacterium]
MVERASYTQKFAAAAPDAVKTPDNALSEMTLEQLPENLREACIKAGWDKLMPVQALAMPYLMAKRDLMIQSRTGSGKTGAFLLPIMHRVDTAKAQCQALVLVPTRELAQQVAREAQLLAGDSGMRVASVYGGTGYGPQLDALREGAHLVVGTPGRVLDHLLRRSLTLEGIQILVFDEADRMLSIGFYQDMKQVQRYLPSGRVNMFMTSATYPPHVMRLAGDFMVEPQLLSLSHSNVHIAETPHSYYEVKPMEKDRALVRIIEMENPASAFIFCNTKQNVHYITAVLQRFGYDADELSGDLAQNKREQVLDRIRQGKLRFLVVTDVAARGIDIPDLSHVFLYEPPEDHEVYIHRAGRTGRAGASGEVISLVDVMEKFALERIGRTYKINFERRDLPTDEDVQGVIGARMTALLEGRLRALDNVQRERLVRTVGLAKSLGESEDGLALMAMILDDIYQGSLNVAPVSPPIPAPPRPAPASRPTPERSGQDRDGRRGRRPERSARSEEQPRERTPGDDAPRDRSEGPAPAGERPRDDAPRESAPRDRAPRGRGPREGAPRQDRPERQPSSEKQAAPERQPSSERQPAANGQVGPDGEATKPKRRRRRRPRRSGPKPSEGGGENGQGGEGGGNSAPPDSENFGNR